MHYSLEFQVIFCCAQAAAWAKIGVTDLSIAEKVPREICQRSFGVNALCIGSMGRMRIPAKPSSIASLSSRNVDIAAHVRTTMVLPRTADGNNRGTHDPW